MGRQYMARTASLLVAACAALVASGIARAQLIVSEKEVRREARVAWLDMKRHIPIEQNPRIQRYVQCVADHILATLPPEQAKLDWEVVVFDQDTINAFAAPPLQ